MSASSRNKRITIQKRKVDPVEGDVPVDGYGDEVEIWRDHFTEYAGVYYGSGNEQRAAAQTQGEQTASFEVPSNSRTRAITIADYRIKFGGGFWNIRAVSEIGQNKEIKLTAIRDVP